jgi:aminopeptidase N
VSGTGRRRALALLVAAAMVTGGCTGPTPVIRWIAPSPGSTGGTSGTSGATLDPEAGRSEPVADPIYPDFGNRSMDVLAYDLDLAWDPARRLLTGTATLTIRPTTDVTEIALDFSDAYTVDSAAVGGAPATPARRGNDLVVPATLAKDARATLTVSYRGTPRPVPMPSGRADFPEGVGLRATADGEAWTMQEPYGAHTWYPANDHPSDEAVYDIEVTVPSGWAAVAHGRLMGVRTGSGVHTYRWLSTDPVATYLATLALGRYTAVSDTGPHALPITYWLRTGRDEALEPALRTTPDLLAWLEERFGPYPFPTAGVVVVDSYSAMETQQMVTYGAKLGTNGVTPADLDLVEEILLHEFAHQWFGDAVTPTDWRGMWLNEGFAMYAEWLWTVDQGWASDASWEAWAVRSDAESRRVAGPPGDPHPDHFGEHNVYAGPAYLLHLIHEDIGDEAFFAMARGWVQSQRNQPVDRARFVAFVNQHTGRDYTGLINTWLDSPTTPS